MNDTGSPQGLRGAWAPFVIAALILPTTVGFLVAGPSLGLALGALTGFVLIWVAARRTPGGMIETQTPSDGRRHVLFVVGREIDDPKVLEAAARSHGVGVDGDGDVVVRVLSPLAAASSIGGRGIFAVVKQRLSAGS